MYDCELQVKMFHILKFLCYLQSHLTPRLQPFPIQFSAIQFNYTRAIQQSLKYSRQLPPTRPYQYLVVRTCVLKLYLLSIVCWTEFWPTSSHHNKASQGGAQTLIHLSSNWIDKTERLNQYCSTQRLISGW